MIIYNYFYAEFFRSPLSQRFTIIRRRNKVILFLTVFMQNSLDLPLLQRTIVIRRKARKRECICIYWVAQFL